MFLLHVSDLEEELVADDVVGLSSKRQAHVGILGREEAYGLLLLVEMVLDDSLLDDTAVGVDDDADEVILEGDALFLPFSGGKEDAG